MMEEIKRTRNNMVIYYVISIAEIFMMTSLKYLSTAKIVRTYNSENI